MPSQIEKAKKLLSDIAQIVQSLFSLVETDTITSRLPAIQKSILFNFVCSLDDLLSLVTRMNPQKLSHALLSIEHLEGQLSILKQLVLKQELFLLTESAQAFQINAVNFFRLGPFFNDCYETLKAVQNHSKDIEAIDSPKELSIILQGMDVEEIERRLSHLEEAQIEEILTSSETAPSKWEEIKKLWISLEKAKAKADKLIEKDQLEEAYNTVNDVAMYYKKNKMQALETDFEEIHQNPQTLNPPMR